MLLKGNHLTNLHIRYSTLWTNIVRMQDWSSAHLSQAAKS